jgi:threonine/homoserine efflux transporter RhtA
MRNRAVALSATAAVFWGISAAVAGGVFDVVSPSRVTQFRAIVVALVFIPIVAFRGAPPLKGSRLLLIAFGFTLGLMMFSYYWAIRLLGVGPGATLQFMGPVLVLAWSRWVRGHRYCPLIWAAALLSVVGVGLVVQAWDVDQLDFVGVSAGGLAAVMFAIYLVLAEKLSHRLPAMAVTGYGFGIAAVAFTVIYPLQSFPSDLSARVWIDLGIVAILGSLLPFLMEISAVRWLAAGLVGVIATLEPVVAAILGFVLLDQVLTPVQVLGSILVVTGVAIVSTATEPS